MIPMCSAVVGSGRSVIEAAAYVHHISVGVLCKELPHCLIKKDSSRHNSLVGEVLVVLVDIDVQALDYLNRFSVVDTVVFTLAFGIFHR